MKTTRQKDRLERIRIVVIYALFGGLWIFLSDTILGWMIKDPAIMTRISVYKGMLFIVLTSALLYFLIARYMMRMVDFNQRLAKSEDRFISIFNNISDSIFIHDAVSGAIVDANESVFGMFGYRREEAIMLDVNEISLGASPYSRVEALQWIRHAAVASIPVVFEWRCKRKDGSLFLAECSMRKTCIGGDDFVIVAVRDITERKQAEEQRYKLEQQMLHVQKLESLGVLAGGIAHDFNNILLSITGNASLALMRLGLESPVVHHLQEIEKAADRAADLARQMLAYSGKGRFVLEALNLNLIVEEMATMLQVSISKKALLRQNLTSQLPSIVADATQIRQIVMNLAINASEAIGENNGVISISTGCMDCDQHYLRETWFDQNLEEGMYVYLEVSDTGCGMSRETMEKIFDPFFTTKFSGRGLGMAAILGIVRGHRGAIKVYSEPGRGSTFKILLPASGRPAELCRGPQNDRAWQGQGTVLLVDDEDAIRAIGTEMLKELGFHVITASDGRVAVELFQREQDRIDLVVLDLTMPHMNGEDAFRELRRIKPTVKVIISSGYNEQEVTQKFIGKGLAGFIQKPYKMSTLTDVIRTILQPLEPIGYGAQRFH
jgi:PAS domain S-box-containing protein